jgi:hypothetical protein
VAADYRRFREETPARNAALRAEAAARQQAELEREQARYAAEQKVSDALQGAYEKSVADAQEERDRILRTGQY